jgi:AcrR family transcriptional regulator
MASLEYKDMLALLEQASATGNPKDPRERKRLLIIEAATELFIRQGYRKTTMDEVARQAGVAKGTLYLHVKTKAELMVLAIVEEKKQYIVAMKDVLEEGIEPRERLRRYLVMLLTFSCEMPLMSRLMSGDREVLSVMAEMPEEMSDQHEQMKVEFLHKMVDEAARPHSFTATEIANRANVIFGMAFFSPVIADPRVRMGMSLESYAELFANMLVDGLAAPLGGDA